MPFQRSGDTGATYPLLMKVAGLRGVDDRTINEVAGFVWRLSTLSAAHMTDYVVDAGTVAMVGGARTKPLLMISTKVGLLSRVRIDGFDAYRLIDDPEFIHLRTRAEVEWERQQQADARNVHLTKLVRLRDGDQCRYCGVIVQWMGRTSARKATFDHLEPGEAGTLDTVVVACKRDNSGQRDIAGEERDELRPPPAEPFYSKSTADWLTRNGHPVQATEQRPGSQPDTAKPARTRPPRQRPGSQPDTASTPPTSGDSDPATGHRAPDPDTPSRPPPNAPRSRLPQDIGTSSVGSGRDGSGSVPTQPSPTIPPARQRKRSRRGTPRDHPPSGTTEP